MENKKEYNFHEMTIDEINEVLQPFIDEQIHNAKDWTERYSGIINYINENYYNLHPLKIPVEKLEQVNRNLKRWKNQFDLIKTSEQPELFEIKRSVESAISSISEQIEYLKRNPTDPIERTIANMLPKINKDVFCHSTFQQWKDLTLGKYDLIKIEINPNKGLRDFMMVFDLIKIKLKLDITDKACIENKIFHYKGKPLVYSQMNNNRNKRLPHTFDHYFN